MAMPDSEMVIDEVILRKEKWMRQQLVVKSCQGKVAGVLADITTQFINMLWLWRGYQLVIFKVNTIPCMCTASLSQMASG